MAGTKVAYHSISDAHPVSLRTSGPHFAIGIMDEDEIALQLNDPSFDVRTDVLEQLRAASRRNGGRLPFHNKAAIFEALAQTLCDSNWHIRNQCIQLIHELVPQFGDELDACLRYVLPRLVACVGDTNVSIRRAAIQTLHVYMKYTTSIKPIFSAIVQHGLENNDARIRKEVTIALPMLCTPEFAQVDFYDITLALAKRLLDPNSGDHSVQSHALLSLEKIKKLVGDNTFNGYVHRLSPPLRRYYYKLTDQMEDEAAPSDYSANGHAFSTAPSRGHAPPATGDYEFGVVPSHIMTKLQDQSNFRTRAQAVEELKLVIKDLNNTSALTPHVPDFIQFLTNLLDDSHFKIPTVTLEILGLLVQRLGPSVQPHLRATVAALSKRMGDNKIVLRQAIMKAMMQLMQSLSPKGVLAVTFDNLAHRNSRVRQETLNICIASLLTFPSYDFDLGEVCQRIAHTLVDPKRQVRQAALECFASLAQAMGPGKLQPLVSAVDSVELSCEGDGVMAAVQARLARRQLPKLNADGLVDYAVVIPAAASSARGNASATPQGADLDWILSASGGSGSSARSTRSDRSEMMELESVTSSSARSTPVHQMYDSPSHGPTPRRHLSAGKGRNRLPWEDSAEPNSVTNGSQMQGKPRGPWAGEDQNADSSSPSKRAGRTNQKAPQESRDLSPEQGSYRQIHMSKYKRCSSSDNVGSLPYSVYNASAGGRDYDDGGWSYPASLANTPRTSSTEVRAFSQSWSEPQMFEDAGKPNKRFFLDPISVSDHAPYDWAGNPDDRKGSKVDNSPIPTKPTLARGASSKKKVPPIPGGRSDKSSTSDYADSGRDTEYDPLDVATTREEMDHGLKSIRNSANKKKANVKNDWSYPDYQESSPDSGLSSLRSDDTAPKKKGKKNDMPFETKPRLVRKPSQNSKSDATASKQSLASPSVPQMDFQPRGGVTFTQNRSSDVEIVGKGYGDEPHQTDPRPSQYAVKAKEKRSQNAKVILSPLGMVNPFAHGTLDLDDDRFPGGVIGRRMFDVTGSTHSVYATGFNDGGLAAKNRRPSREMTDGRENLPAGIYGYSVKQNSLDHSSEDGEDEGSDDEDVASMSMAPTTKEALHRKKQEEISRKKEEEAEQRRRQEEKRKQDEKRRQEAEQRRLRQEEEQRAQEEEAKQQERERQQGKLKRLTGNVETGLEALSISGSSQQPPQSQQQPSSSPASSASSSNSGNRNSKFNSTASSQRKKPPPSEPSSAEDAEGKPFKDPQKAFDEALKSINHEQWERKMTGLEHIRRLSLHHPEVISQAQALHTLNLALIHEVKNLRSQVSRLAIVALGEMYTRLGRPTETDLDQTVKCLISKYGESNAFIKEELDRTFASMVDNLTPQRAMCALINGGASHKNSAVRRATSQFLVPVVERMGPGRVLSGIKDVTDKILPTAVNFLLDGSQETRYNGQRILYMLMNHDDFDRMMTKHVPANMLRNVQDKLDNLKKKGLGDPPNESCSAKTHRSGRERSNNSFRGNSASSTGSGPNGSVPVPTNAPKRLSAARTDEATLEAISVFCTQMKASNWQERQIGISEMVKMAESRPSAVANNITKIFDSFIPCLKDSNSKTNLHALQRMIQLTPLLQDNLSAVVNMLVQNLSANLSSKNKDIYDTASSALDELMNYLDAQLLIQPMVQQAQAGSARIKPDMVQRVSFLTKSLGEQGSRVKTIRMHVLPLMWHLLSTVPTSGTVPGQSGSLRVAVSQLANTLHSFLGEDLTKAAKENSKMTPRMLQFLQDLIDNP